ncbi:DUF692 domain-containing protein [Nocardia jejuensis]|uniref:DUF692 domain-containing protein n=1 Tax=Nocardia jejuensis TaxID=328049 RepID=UPI000AF8B5D7|nr:DUF692 domain-containing protein [Nocardia jejuensis]
MGVGWRSEICGIIAELEGIGFCEVIAEALPPASGSQRRARFRPWQTGRRGTLARTSQPSARPGSQREADRLRHHTEGEPGLGDRGVSDRRAAGWRGWPFDARQRAEQREAIGGKDGVVVPEELSALIARGISAVPHGVSLSLGGAEPVQESRVIHLAECARALGSPLASEHIAFVRANGVEAGHLLPVPRTREALDALTRNISRTQRELDVPLAVENIATLFEWPDAEFTEAEFLRELVERTGVHLLVDIANVYANARNSSRDPLTELLSLPTERLAYCHIAGGHESGGRYHDTHVHPVPAEVLALVADFTAASGVAARRVPFMLERDGNYPPATELITELNAIATAADRPTITRRPTPAIP